MALFKLKYFISTSVNWIMTKFGRIMVNALLRISDEGFTNPPLGGALVAV